MEKTNKWTAPLFVLFFVISGAELELNVFTDIAVVVIGLVYIVARSAGKISGAFDYTIIKENLLRLKTYIKHQLQVFTKKGE